MDNLKDLGYVHILPGFPKEEEYISYNPIKKTDILQLLCSNAEPDEINLSIPEISYPSLKKLLKSPFLIHLDTNVN